MSKKEDKKPQLIAKLNRWYKSAEGARKNVDFNWYKYDLYVQGNHYAKYDRETQQILTSPESDGRPKVVINKIYPTLRSVRNYVVRNRPRAEVTPMNMEPEDIDQAIAMNHFLDYLHDKLGLRDKFKASVWDALKYSVGFWQILWDEDQKEIVVNDLDPYDLYFDPAARSEREARYMCLAIRRNLEDLKEDSKYDKEALEKIKGDNKLAASSFKERLIKSERGSSSSEKGSGTVIVKEFWYKDTKKGKKGEDDKSIIRVTTMIEDQIVRDEDTDLEIIPVFRLKGDIKPRSLYAEGWVKNLIPPQRELNRVVSHIAEYNLIMNRGKWISDKGAGVRIINNQNGQIIEKKRGYDVKQGAIAPLNQAAYQLEESMNRYLEDIGGFHDASMGRIPAGAKSGRALETLQQGDANNMSEIVENSEVFLEEAFEYMLSLASKKYQFARNIVPFSRAGERLFMKVIGEGADNKPEGTVTIPNENIVDVKITSHLAQSTEARQDKADKLYEMGAIDEQTLLEFYAIGNIAEVIQRVRKNKLESQQQELDMQAASQVQNAELQAPEPMGAKAAMAAIRTILQGGKPEMPQAVSPEFIQYIDQFIVEEQLPAELERALQLFRDEVVQKTGGGMSAPPAGGVPGAPSA